MKKYKNVNSIETKHGGYSFNKVDLYVGRRKINKQQSKDNLLTFKTVLDKNKVKFGLIYGTLLGAVREKDFITHDEDVDVFILNENKQIFLDLLFELREVGFEVVRYDGTMLSLMRNDDYIDVYIFKKKYFIYRTAGKLIHRSYYFKYEEKISFLGVDFYGPKNVMKFIIKNYGKDWNVPKVHAHAKPYTTRFIIKKFIEKKINLISKKFS